MPSYDGQNYGKLPEKNIDQFLAIIVMSIIPFPSFSICPDLIYVHYLVTAKELRLLKMVHTGTTLKNILVSEIKQAEKVQAGKAGTEFTCTHRGAPRPHEPRSPAHGPQDFTAAGTLLLSSAPTPRVRVHPTNAYEMTDKHFL